MSSGARTSTRGREGGHKGALMSKFGLHDFSHFSGRLARGTLVARCDTRTHAMVLPAAVPYCHAGVACWRGTRTRARRT